MGLNEYRVEYKYTEGGITYDVVETTQKYFDLVGSTFIVRVYKYYFREELHRLHGPAEFGIREDNGQTVYEIWYYMGVKMSKAEAQAINRENFMESLIDSL